ncbi:MAG: type II toxin-antitoxin system HicA family toxin [Patescibacteria group bacterium]
MPRPPSRTPKQIIAILRRHGFLLDHTTGSHFVFYHPVTKRRTMVAYHTKTLPKGTLLVIMKQAGLSADNL